MCVRDRNKCFFGFSGEMGQYKCFLLGQKQYKTEVPGWKTSVLDKNSSSPEVTISFKLFCNTFTS